MITPSPTVRLTPEEEDVSPFQVPSWFISMIVHMLVLIGLTLAATSQPVEDLIRAFTTSLPAADEAEMNLETPDEFYFSNDPQEKIGANSLGGSEMAFAMTPNISEVSALPHGSMIAGGGLDNVTGLVGPLGETGTQAAAGGLVGDISVRQDIALATGPHFSRNMVVRGAAGVGTTVAEGAVDRITHEILLSLEERKTLVVWFFDQSGSLESQRAEINKRFERIYEELGVVQAAGNAAFKRHSSKPLLTAAVAFGQKVTFLTQKPTDDVRELMYHVGKIQTDKSGVEMTFSAIHQAVEKYKEYRLKEPRRNLMFVVFTDEVGDDDQGLDDTVTACRKHEIPVYVVGVPAPFGRKEVEIKYVDPDPQFDQTPQWVPVRQGPESFKPEIVKLGFTNVRGEEGPMESGFGPYSLTRLCYETGGIYFTVHPNRDVRNRVDRSRTSAMTAHLDYFFDPQVMRSYRPDYVSNKEYDRLMKVNKARQALVKAAQFSQITPMESPATRFPKVNEADLANKLSIAQRQAAVLEPKVNQVFETLKTGEKDRDKLTQPRWQAGYDLAMGRTLAVKVRTEAYNAMLAKAKQGMKFQDPKNDTWELVPADEITVGSALEKHARQAKEYLERVAKDHDGTPWAMLAKREMSVPVGWRWIERYTGVNAPKEAPGGNGGAPAPSDDELRKLNRNRPQKRPAPKL